MKTENQKEKCERKHKTKKDKRMKGKLIEKTHETGRYGKWEKVQMMKGKINDKMKKERKTKGTRKKMDGRKVLRKEGRGKNQKMSDENRTR